MGQVFLKKKQNISEEDVTIHDPIIMGQIAQLDKQLADAERKFNAAQKIYNDDKNRIMQAKANLQKQDADKLKAQGVKVAQENQNNNQENQNSNQNTNESLDYIYRKAIRLSKKLYEEKKAIGLLAHDIKDELDELELSYTMNFNECKKLARKVEDVLDDNFDKKNSDNK